MSDPQFECPRCGHCCPQQTEQEPVAWVTRGKLTMIRADAVTLDDTSIPLYVAPPKKEWVGMTDEERHGIREWQRIQEELGPVWAPMMLYLYEAIEAKLREKNHG